MKKLFSVLLFVLALSPNLFGGITGKINGHVTDQDGQALPGTNIILEGTNRGAAADKNGYFIILNISPGSFIDISTAELKSKRISTINDNLDVFNFKSAEDVTKYEKLLVEGFKLISEELAKLDQIFVDTKFEFGYVEDLDGNQQLIYIDEGGTPDSSRIWDGAAYRDGKIIENSKEGFRQLLISTVPESDVLLNKDRMDEREQLAKDFILPESVMLEVSNTYVGIASKIIGKEIVIPEDPRQEVINILDTDYDLIVK